jgi:hypothetical protein
MLRSFLKIKEESNIKKLSQAHGAVFAFSDILKIKQVI